MRLERTWNACRIPTTVLGLAILAAWPAQSKAATDFESVVRMSAIDTDNVAHTPVGTDSQVYQLATTFEIVHRQPTLDADLDAAISFRRFSESDYGTETLPQLRGFLAWEILPDSLRFVVEDNLGQVGTAPSQSLVPADRENLNVLAAGPDLVLLADQPRRIRVRARYTDVDYESSDLDSRRYYGELRGETDLAAGGIAYLVGSAGSTEFDSARREGYDLQRIAVGLDIAGRRTSILAEVGSAFAKDQGERTSGIQAQVEASRRLSSRSLLRLTFLRTFGDSADVFSASQQFEDVLGDTTILELDGGLGRQELAALAYEYDSGRLQTSIEGGWSKQSGFSDGSGDRRVSDAEINVAYAFRPVLKIGGYARTSRQRSSFEAFDLTDESAGLFVEWRFAQPMSVEFLTERYTRKDSPMDFEETRFTIELRWNAYQRRSAVEAGPDTWSLRRRRSLR